MYQAQINMNQKNTREKIKERRNNNNKNGINAATEAEKRKA